MAPKLGLYSITYAGMWYDGPALSITQFIDRAKAHGVQGVELDCRAPHAVPYALSQRERKEIVEHAAGQGMEICAIAANNDFSSPVTEHREANIQMVVELIHLAKDLGAPVVRVFTAWMGSSRRNGMGTYEVARPGYERAFPDTVWSERWQYCLDAFGVVSKFAEEDGVTLALQNHPPVVRNSADVEAMVHEVGSPNFKVSFDISGERAWQGTDWVLERARCLKDLWVHSHYGGDFARQPDGSVVRVPMGRGMSPRDGGLDWNDQAWAQGMREAGFNGYVCYEGCSPTYLSNGRLIPIEVMERRVDLALDYMRQLWAKYDLT